MSMRRLTFIICAVLVLMVALVGCDPDPPSGTDQEQVEALLTFDIGGYPNLDWAARWKTLSPKTRESCSVDEYVERIEALVEEFIDDFGSIDSLRIVDGTIDVEVFGDTAFASYVSEFEGQEYLPMLDDVFIRDGGRWYDVDEASAICPDSSEGNRRLSAEQRNELFDDARIAAEATNSFWARHWSEFFTNSYRSPRLEGGYLPGRSPTCGGVYEDHSGNAYYCIPDRYIAWDWKLLAAKYHEIGDAFVYFLIAHEWAHAVQHQLDDTIVLTARELQADCLAAAALVGAARDGDIAFEPGDDSEIFLTLVFVADTYEWGDPGDHGSVAQRIGSYQRGAENIRDCFPRS